MIRVSASVGLAEARRTDGPLSWLDRADKRLYRAKGLGKNRAVGDSSSPEAPSR
jgi:PleD family two-component response regulator